MGDEAAGVQIRGLEGRMDRHEESSVREHTDIWDAIDRLRKSVNDVTKRPPAWCTLAISLLTFFLGAVITLVGMLTRS